MKMNDFVESVEMGAVSETTFEMLSEKKGYIVTPATTKENIFKHIDFHLFKGSRVTTVDVKARKSVSRGVAASEYEEGPEDEWIWMEFKNVNGNVGWLYGKADLIAFELPNRFVLVQRKKLARLAEKVIDTDNTTRYARSAKHRVYSRVGRKDLIGMLTLADILSIKHWIWEK